MRSVTMQAVMAVLALVWLGLAPGLARASAVAVEVDGQVIAVEDIERRVRDIHRAKPRMGASGDGAALSVIDIVGSLVDERLLIKEAAAMALDDGPEFRSRMRAFVRDQSILRLYGEEVVDRVVVDDDAIRERYVSSLGSDAEPGGEIPERMRERIAGTLRKEREKALADAFVARLREQAGVVVHRDVLDGVTLPLPRGTIQDVVAEIDGEPLPMADFMADLGRECAKAGAMLQRVGDAAAREAWFAQTKERVLEDLLTNALVGREALRRDYSRDPEFGRAVAVRREAMLLDAFRTQVLLPLAEPEAEELEDFYRDNAALYTRGCEVRFGELRFKDREQALAALDELRRGAVFGYLARRLGGGSTPGDGWLPEEALPPVFREALDVLPEGGTSDVLALGRDLVVLHLRGRRGCAVTPYDEVLPDLRRRVQETKYAEARERYVQALRKRANIVMHDGVLEDLEEAFWRNPPEPTAQPERGEP